MHTQNQIKRVLLKPTNIEYIIDLLAPPSQVCHRTDLAKRVCEKFGFHDVGRHLQIGGCLKALRELESAGHFSLPPALKSLGPKFPRRLSNPVPLPVDVPSNAGEVKDLHLMLVESVDEMRIWNELMIDEHPLGAGPLVGRQLRYLINSRYGWLGGFGFAAPALQLADRDAWIGWSSEERKSYLHFIVGMSRFLIRPSVQCHNLASKTLSMSITKMLIDFEQKYNYRPLLIESFVDLDHYEGTCYRAANWIEIGKTKGRGRQDEFSESALSVKSIYVYPIEKDFRKKLGLSTPVGMLALNPTDGMDGTQWAEQEFGGAPLGDIRLSNRLVKVASAKAEAPGEAFSATVNGNLAETKAYYRMMDQPDDSAVNLPNILAPHRQRTMQRMMGQKTVLCIQDGSDINYTNLEKCKGLGNLSANQTGAKCKGLHLHSTFVVEPNGVPLGVLKAQCVAPEAKSPKDKRRLSVVPIEEKKTFAWIEHHRDLVKIAKKMPQTRLVDICDREGDFYELFEEQKKDPCVDLIVRAHHDRAISKEPLKLFASARQAEILSQVNITIQRQSARPKKSKQKARPARIERMAKLTIRGMPIQIQPPKHYSDRPPIDIFIIHALEDNPPENTEAIEWFLLTTRNATTAAEAEQCLRWYTLRWRIEDWHRVLKSGCRIGDLAHESAERMRRAIAINMVIAWRLMLMTLMGRETPGLPIEVLFSDIEIRTMHAYAKKKHFPYR